MEDTSRSFTAGQRKAAAGRGAARSDGSFPILNKQDLLNAVRALGRAKNPDAAKRHIIKRARALGLVAALPKEWDVSEQLAPVTCTHEDCERSFLTDTAMEEHALAVHTFDDKRRLVQEAIREKYGRKGSYGPGPRVSSIYTWILDQADDWAVFERESDSDGTQLWQVSYAITDNTVTLGEPVQVVRRTVFEPVKDGGTLTANGGAA